jgi:hypothetical protein
MKKAWLTIVNCQYQNQPYHFRLYIIFL